MAFNCIQVMKLGHFVDQFEEPPNYGPIVHPAPFVILAHVAESAIAAIIGLATVQLPVLVDELEDSTGKSKWSTNATVAG
jgi:hypothetical protein